MRATLDFIVFAVFIVFAFHLSNLADKLEREAELNKKGVLKHIDMVMCVKGSPDLQGSTMSLYMYKDRISMDETLFVPLDRVRLAHAFRIDEVSVTHRLAGQNPLIKTQWSKKIWSVAYLLFKMKTNHYLSIEYTDQQNNVCKFLFLAYSRNMANAFAAGVNHQIGNAMCQESELRLS